MDDGRLPHGSICAEKSKSSRAENCTTNFVEPGLVERNGLNFETP